MKLCTFRKHVQQEYNVGFKIPRSDQCNICRRHEIELQNEKDPTKRKILEENLKEHQCDASDVRDFIYNAFQESREQLGKILSFLQLFIGGWRRLYSFRVKILIATQYVLKC